MVAVKWVLWELREQRNLDIQSTALDELTWKVSLEAWNSKRQFIMMEKYINYHNSESTPRNLYQITGNFLEVKSLPTALYLATKKS